jgi:glutaredoxin
MITSTPPPFPNLPRRNPETAFQKTRRLLGSFAPWLAIGAAVYLYIAQSFTPIEVFTTEGQRREFLERVSAPHSTRVIALVTDWCPACKSLEHNLQSQGVEFVRLDIEKNEQGRRLYQRVFELTGSNSIPKVILDRNLVSQGRLYAELFKKEL